MLSGPHQKFCDGIVSGMTQRDAYHAAYPKCGLVACESKASRLVRMGKITAEINRQRALAETLAGSSVLTLKEKREFLARVVRTPIGNIDHTSDLAQGHKEEVNGGEEMPTIWKTKIRTIDKIAAIKIDNDLAEQGAEAGVNKAITIHIKRFTKST
ncbi:hypothetical protein UFOVP1329_25 [uncultured Caudovirales phage]|uniref:Terminase small subunit n=1 Tax=uncultured Caudovirales phage TaxID=2100421 RepID=A0A6J5SS38_9CAUD|nr:hypothetical protein UFOVP1150_6 [uncultured Caudovirales phage]CAB4199159.1 hypothetical protein UFOVP1329_25 [uncultured Caudovirales phage]CAB4218342.1 hypothetical protein UFOVP1595_11 [uncultured Caudovirales phage]